MSAKLITSIEQMRSLLPNIISPVKGETPLFDKFEPFIEQAEEWVACKFTSAALLDSLCTAPDTEPLRKVAARLVAAEALRLALPALDIVLTPNGFATVGTQNLVAASKARVDRLMEYTLELRDSAIEALLDTLPQYAEWLNTDQALFFAETLFPNINLASLVMNKDSSTSKWERYPELRSQVLNFEACIADDYISHELLGELRLANLYRAMDSQQLFLAENIKTITLEFLNSGNVSARRLYDLVSYIRRNPDSFKSWFHSAVAEQFNPPVFENKKHAAGYFF